MKPYLYLSLIPEALIASHLSPEDYGSYLSVGTKQRSRGQAIFFKLTDQFARSQLDALGVDAELDRPSPASPRRSYYLSVYRALERTPLAALESLHLATEDGRVLTLLPQDYKPDLTSRYHLYQEFCPATPRIVSRLEPKALAEYITNPHQRVSLPAVVFADLRLDELKDNPGAVGLRNLPYRDLEHLRDCLRELLAKPNKTTKTVVRFLQQDVLFRTLNRGFYVAAVGGEFRYFPMPTIEELESTYSAWWRSALSTFGG